MKFETPKCPQCGELCDGTLETVPGIALVIHNANGTSDYVGETKMIWDEQRTPEEDGKVRLICHNGHDWLSNWNNV